MDILLHITSSYHIFRYLYVFSSVLCVQTILTMLRASFSVAALHPYNPFLDFVLAKEILICYPCYFSLDNFESHPTFASEVFFYGQQS